MIGLLKNPLSICQSGWKEIRNALPVIHWVRWEPRTRISAIVRRRLKPRLNYVCDANKCSKETWGAPSLTAKTCESDTPFVMSFITIHIASESKCIYVFLAVANQFLLRQPLTLVDKGIFVSLRIQYVSTLLAFARKVFSPAKGPEGRVVSWVVLGDGCIRRLGNFSLVRKSISWWWRCCLLISFNYLCNVQGHPVFCY